MADPDLNLLDDLVRATIKAGADAADTVLSRGQSVSVTRRFGKPEALERSESQDLGLRAIIGKKQAIVSTTDLNPQTLQHLAAQVVSMARAVPDDPWCGLAPDDILVQTWPDLDLCDAEMPTVAALAGCADAAEDAARAVKGVTNSEGADASFGISKTALVTSQGFAGAYESSGGSFSVSVIAGEGETMERDYDWDSAVYFADFKSPEEIGATAGARAVKRLNPKKAPTASVPVIYDPRISGGLISTLAGAASGTSVARGTTLLKDRMGDQILPEHITITDDPHIKRGHRSRPFDGEGLATQKTDFIENGVLKTWFLDLSTARQLDLPPTGHAVRGIAGPPGPRPSNLYINPGEKSPQDLIGEIKDGFYITEMMGSSVSILTGDYSRGAAGFWIKDGQLAWPVSEVTVAGNLLDMWKNLQAANDLVHRTGMDAPTLRIDGMTVAGV